MSDTGLTHYREALNAELMTALRRLTDDISAVAQRQERQAETLAGLAADLARLRNAVSSADSTALSMAEARITAARQTIERQVAEAMGQTRAEVAELRARVAAIEAMTRLAPWLLGLLALIALGVLALVAAQGWMLTGGAR